ncbi:MAG: HEAT repeat domain-containing protein, partial [Terriglobales bacterium]
LPALAAAALLVVGLAVGWLARGTAAPAANASEASQIADLRQEVQSTQQLAVLSLLQQRSASDRLQGVSYGAPIAGADPRITAALLNSLKYDSSPDVRLAALDALNRHAAIPAVQTGLIEAFSYQSSPLLQVALVDSFIQDRDAQARALLQQISSDKKFNVDVRQRAAWGLAQPTWN